MITRKIIKAAKDDSGAAAIEYGLLAALVSVAAIGAFTAMGSSLEAIYGDVSDTLQTVIDIIED